MPKTSEAYLRSTTDPKIDVIDGYHDVPSQNSADNNQLRDVIGNKTDTVAGDSLYSQALKLFRAGYGELVTKTADCTAASPISLFTVTGDVVIKIIGIVKTSLTTTDAITASVGVAGNPAILIPQVADATTLVQNVIWHDATPDAMIEQFSVFNEYIISNGQDIILTTTGTVTAGSIAFYCFWLPLSSDGNVVAA
jgi:hypothetical protein